MPTYEYHCATCGKRFEHFQSITSPSLTNCTHDLCVRDDGGTKGEGNIHRLMSGGAGLVFKGEGFYLTDYARKGEKGAEKSNDRKGQSAANKSPGGSDGSAATTSGSSTTD